MKRFNPLFDDVASNRQAIVASEPVEARNDVAISPISGKPMQKVLCDGIEAYYDEDNRLCLPIVDK